MVKDILLNRIISLTKADARQVRFAVELCKEKGVLTKQEVMQLTSQGLPIYSILSNILKPAQPNEINFMLDSKRVTYEDLLCILGIIAQDLELLQQKKAIAEWNFRSDNR